MDLRGVRITVAKQTLSRASRDGLLQASARARHHAQAEEAIEDFTKTSERAGRSRARKGAACWQRRDWFQDEARIGQEQDHRRWAKRGTRRSAPRDQRTASTYTSERSARSRERGAARILPAATPSDERIWSKSPRRSAPGAHAVLLVDQARMAFVSKIVIPPILPLSRCRRNALSSIRLKIFGSTCVTTGSRTASSNRTTISLITAATPGIRSSIDHGRSCPLD